MVINGLRNVLKRLNPVSRSDEAEDELQTDGLPPSMLGQIPTPALNARALARSAGHTGDRYPKEASPFIAWPAKNGDGMLHRIVWDYIAARRSHKLKGKELAELQGRKLRSLVDHAYRTVPFYHDAFARRNITPDQIRSAEQLRLLPVLTRQDIQDNYPDRMLASGKSTAGTVIRHTSGTIGRPLEVVWDNEDCDRNTARHLVMAQSLGLSLLDKTVDIMYLGPEKPEPSTTPEMSRLRKILVGPITTPMIFTLRSRKTGFRRSVLEVEKELLKLRPTAIYSRPSYLRRLGSQLDREGKKLQVGKILAGGEYLSSSVRKELEGYFDSEVFNGLGAQELGTLGAECSEHRGIHLFSDHFAFELLRDGEPASAGEAAELVVTSLHNRTMPLIRYKLGDVVVPESGVDCACGLGLPRLREIRGRLDDGLELPDGTRIPVGPVVDYIESLGLRDYQLVQTGKGSVLVKLVQEQDTKQTVQTLFSYLRSLFGNDVQIRLEEWKEDDIPPKYRPVMRL